MHPLEKQRIQLSPTDKDTLENAAKEFLQTTSKELLLDNITLYKNFQKKENGCSIEQPFQKLKIYIYFCFFIFGLSYPLNVYGSSGFSV